MNSLTREGKFIVFGGLAVIAIAAILIFAVDWTDLKMKKEIRNTIAEQEVVKARATEALKVVADVANELSGITSGAVFNFEVVDADGRSANFGIVQWVDDVEGERIVEEHMVTFREVGSSTNNTAEVDRATNKVVSMHRSVPEFAKSGNAYPAKQLEATAREFVQRVYPDFGWMESPSLGLLEFDPGSKTAPGAATNHFFRWNDKRFAVPSGLNMDIPPFIQVGITQSGFIFSYDNTLQLYLNLPKESLRAICGFVEMPKTDDSSIDREKGTVKVYFTEYEPFQNRYLILPYEPEKDFEGCSESAKSVLRHIQDAQVKDATKSVKLYYYNSDLDRDETGNIMCSRKGLVAVERKIPSTINPIKDAINLLLKGELLKEEKDRGVTTEYPLDGLTLKDTVLNNSILTLAFDDAKNKTVGGACRVGILWFQIEATAKQFPEVKEIRFLPEELFQP